MKDHTPTCFCGHSITRITAAETHAGSVRGVTKKFELNYGGEIPSTSQTHRAQDSSRVYWRCANPADAHVVNEDWIRAKRYTVALIGPPYSGKTNILRELWETAATASATAGLGCYRIWCTEASVLRPGRVGPIDSTGAETKSDEIVESKEYETATLAPETHAAAVTSITPLADREDYSPRTALSSIPMVVLGFAPSADQNPVYEQKPLLITFIDAAGEHFTRGLSQANADNAQALTDQLPGLKDPDMLVTVLDGSAIGPVVAARSDDQLHTSRGAYTAIEKVVGERQSFSNSTKEPVRGCLAISKADLWVHNMKGMAAVASAPYSEPETWALNAWSSVACLAIGQNFFPEAFALAANYFTSLSAVPTSAAPSAGNRIRVDLLLAEVFRAAGLVESFWPLRDAYKMGFVPFRDRFLEIVDDEDAARGFYFGNRSLFK